MTMDDAREPPAAVVARAVDLALAEDLGSAGDVTTDAVLPAGAQARARIVARSRLVLAGISVAAAVFQRLDPALEFHALFADGAELEPGTELARIRGPARPILRGERTALNFLMRMCGIATAARGAVREVEGTGVRILDTRKTAPGLRRLDKYAVACGGASNHRMGLYDAMLIKDTHLDAGCAIGEAVRRAADRGFAPRSITVEVRDLDELRQAIAAGAGRALLDNMDLDALKEAVRLAGGRIELEASGGLRPGGLRAVAASGVDCISLGWLTHSAPAADLALETRIGSGT
jgi:nicotinate-nucleotide pyrophosphorylase (carboxylating)